MMVNHVLLLYLLGVFVANHYILIYYLFFWFALFVSHFWCKCYLTCLIPLYLIDIDVLEARGCIISVQMDINIFYAILRASQSLKMTNNYLIDMLLCKFIYVQQILSDN